MVDFAGVLPGWQFILFLALFFVFFVSGIVTVVVVYSRTRWNFKVVILENVDGRGYVITRRDKARLVAFGDGGEELFFLKKLKKYRIGYGKRIGPKQVAWAIGADGYYYNVTFGNLDDKLREVGILPADRNMRFANASVRKGIETTYGTKNWMDKYGTVLYFGLFLLTLMLFAGVIWYVFDKQVAMMNLNQQNLLTQKEVAELLKETLGAVDNIRSGGSGIVANPGVG